MRLLYDTKGRFRLHAIRDEEAKVGHIKQVFDIPLSEKKKGADKVCFSRQMRIRKDHLHAPARGSPRVP